MDDYGYFSYAAFLERSEESSANAGPGGGVASPAIGHSGKWAASRRVKKNVSDWRVFHIKTLYIPNYELKCGIDLCDSQIRISS
jgi:hypothetical protein